MIIILVDDLYHSTPSLDDAVLLSMDYFNIWEFVAGLGIFLFGMLQMEDAIKALAGRRIKSFLRKHGKSKLKGILSGAGVTAILQSSSVVSLIVLAFVGAGTISMRQAIAMVFGSNLGTTITGWLVAMVGFKADIELLAFPLIGVGSMLVIIMSGRAKWPSLGKALMGLGLLFLGLEYMKTSVSLLAENFDLAPFVDYPPVVFLLIGLGLTAIIQSSSASMVITLSAVYSNIIPLESAAAMIIGSDLGTTVTVLLGGMTGVPSKKRVALAHLIFNLVTDILAFIALGWLLSLIAVAEIQDPLLALVLFHSSFNALGLILFFPFINMLARFLENRFQEASTNEGKYIHELTAEVPEAGIEAFRLEINHLVGMVVALAKANFSETQSSLLSLDFRQKSPHQRSFKSQYQSVKQLEGELFEFYTKLQQQELEPYEADQLNQLISATQYFLHAAKGSKDIHKNLQDMNASSLKILNQLFDGFKESSISFYQSLVEVISQPQAPTIFEDLTSLMIQNQSLYQELLRKLYHDLSRRKLKQVEIATLLNVNRELFSSRKGLIRGLKDYLLDAKESKDFENVPVAVAG